MSATLKIRPVGNSMGVILPQDVLNSLHVGNGDTLHVVAVPNGVKLMAHDPEFARHMEIAREVMHRRRHVLAALAK